MLPAAAEIGPMQLGTDRVETIVICLVDSEIQEAVEGVAPPAHLRRVVRQIAAMVGMTSRWAVVFAGSAEVVLIADSGALMVVSKKIATAPIADSVAMLQIVELAAVPTGKLVGGFDGAAVVLISKRAASELADLPGSMVVRVLVASAKTILVVPNDLADWASMWWLLVSVLPLL